MTASTDASKAEILGALGRVLGAPQKMIPLHEPEFRGNELAYVSDCIETGWVSSVGAFVTRLEKDLGTLFDRPHAVATSTGTAALHVCLLLAGVEPGDHVLLPTLTFVATANAVSYTGAVPHFVDAEPHSLGVDASKLREHLRETARIENGRLLDRATGARIRALVVTHIFGHPADLDVLAELAREFHLVLVEDAAESIGSLYRGEPTGRHGLVSAVSFNGNKVVTTGGGGAILTGSKELGERAKHLTTTARVPHRWGYMHDEVGFNYRLPNLNAALGCAQLERLDDMLRRKRELSASYRAAFATVEGASFLEEPANTTSNYWLNAIVLDEELAAHRDELLDALNAAHYMSRPLWTSMHRLPMFEGCPRMDVSVAESLEARVINIPSSPRLADLSDTADPGSGGAPTA
ncbi:Putative pyridoxal phosphate-dependent aminotransferase EpsN [Planctomycetes bacterium Poly30]|uniref:Pyridoxal phosphate-dependent aminotransferase EpsN n=1 Tax=Saltatorellus ferox TaxID=2528018 RepID=A0A518EX33_9BACT|nr:Putative pyridoxal phosphate-dependent aminotransferase EpsN [Planctomycetes bacterium Poly30]